MGRYKLIFTITLIYFSVNLEIASTQPNNVEWLNSLRETIYKAVPPGSWTNREELHRNLLEARFYNKPEKKTNSPSSSETRMITNALVSRGDVYYLDSKSRWILCEIGCTDCHECLQQDWPSFKWTVHRNLQKKSTKYELRLTVVPQLREFAVIQNFKSKVFEENSKIGRKRSIESITQLKRLRTSEPKTTSLNETSNYQRRKKQLPPVLTVANISRTTERLVNTEYPEDFELCSNYSKLFNQLSMFMNAIQQSNNESLPLNFTNIYLTSEQPLALINRGSCIKRAKVVLIPIISFVFLILQ